MLRDDVQVRVGQALLSDPQVPDPIGRKTESVGHQVVLALSWTCRMIAASYAGPPRSELMPGGTEPAFARPAIDRDPRQQRLDGPSALNIVDGDSQDLGDPLVDGMFKELRDRVQLQTAALQQPSCM